MIKRGLLEIEYQYRNDIIKLKKFHSKEHYGEADILLNRSSRFDLVIKSKHAESLLLSKKELITIGEGYSSLFYKIRKKWFIQFALLELKLKQKIKEIDSFVIKKAKCY